MWDRMKIVTAYHHAVLQLGYNEAWKNRWEDDQDRLHDLEIQYTKLLRQLGRIRYTLGLSDRVLKTCDSDVKYIYRKVLAMFYGLDNL